MPFLETILVEEGQFPFLPWHQQRLERTLLRHGIPAVYDMAALLCPPENGRWRCRVVYDEQLFMSEYLPYAPRQIRTLLPMVDETITYCDKTTDRSALDALFAQRGEADDVLIVQRGLITDTTIANVACYMDGQWLTPKRPLLEGTARARLLEMGVLKEADIPFSVAVAAEKIAVMNALSGFVEVSGGILPKI